jgi:hypothetical protein
LLFSALKADDFCGNCIILDRAGRSACAVWRDARGKRMSEAVSTLHYR